jgi:hypothetical protein
VTEARGRIRDGVPAASLGDDGWRRPWSDDLIAAGLGTWLRDQREERGWSRAGLARRLIAAARAAGDQSMPGADSMCHNICRRERGLAGLSERHRLNCCRAFGIRPAGFGPTRPGLVPLPAAAGVPPGDAVACRKEDDGHVTVEREVLMAVHEGSDHAEQAERRDIGEATLEQLHADVARLSARSMTGDPFSGFLEMRRARERVYRLLEGHLRPSDQADLYFLVGCLSDLMAVAASGLGYPQAAEELLRAGWAYAAAIGHRPLTGHLRLQLASIALVGWPSPPGPRPGRRRPAVSHRRPQRRVPLRQVRAGRGPPRRRGRRPACHHRRPRCPGT